MGESFQDYSWPRGYKVEYSLKLKIKRNDCLLGDTCLQAANHLRMNSSFITSWPEFRIFRLTSIESQPQNAEFCR